MSRSPARTSAAVAWSCCTTRRATTPGRQLPLRRLRAGRHRPRHGHRSAAGRRRLELARGGARRPMVPSFLAPSGTVTRVASESFGGMDGEPSQRGARDQGVLVPGSARSRPTSRPGATCSARRPDCRRCRPGSSPCPAVEATRSMTRRRTREPAAERPGPATRTAETPRAAAPRRSATGCPRSSPTRLRSPGGRGPCGRHRSGRHRRRARLGLPVLPTRLPDPAAAGRAPVRP